MYNCLQLSAGVRGRSWVPPTEIEVRPIRISHLEWGWTWGLMMNAVPCLKVSRPFYEPSARLLASENGRASASAESLPIRFFFFQKSLKNDVL